MPSRDTSCLRSVRPRPQRTNEDDLYNQRSMTETETPRLSARTTTVRAREWYREFRETVPMCTVYNIKQYVAA